MNGKGDKRRPESKIGNFNQGYDEIVWSKPSTNKNTLTKPSKKIPKTP
jgi:hypothetical protein